MSFICRLGNAGLNFKGQLDLSSTVYSTKASNSQSQLETSRLRRHFIPAFICGFLFQDAIFLSGGVVLNPPPSVRSVCLDEIVGLSLFPP